MSVCKCSKCDGTNQTAVCEYQMNALKSGLYLQENFSSGLFVVAMVLCLFGVFGF